MFKCIYQDAQESPETITALFNSLTNGEEVCEKLRCVFKIADDPMIHMWPLIDLPDFPNFEEVFIKLNGLEKFDIYQIEKK